jgi:uncharacterized delta-60 repeat protein
MPDSSHGLTRLQKRLSASRNLNGWIYNIHLIGFALIFGVMILLPETSQAARPESTSASVLPTSIIWAHIADILITPGALDLTFDPSDGANDIVFAVAAQPNGQVLIGGQFTQVDSAAHNGVARLNANGSLDSSFTTNLTGAGFAGLTSLALQSNGKVVIGGAFTQVNGAARSNIARLNADGTLDAAFDPGAGVTDNGAYLDCVKLQPDGKPLIGGVFTNVGGVPRNNIARLTTTGALDTSFDPGSGANNEVSAIAIQPSDGKILVGGVFTTNNNLAHNRLARLNTSGSVDGAFNPDIDGSVLAIVVQPDNKILIGGTFTQVNGTSRNRIARLNKDGSLDTSFDPPGPPQEVDAIALQLNGRIVIGGKFTSLDGVKAGRVARLNADGSLDTTFNPGQGASYTVYAVTMQPDGKVLIGGGFQTVDGISRNRIARLLGDKLVYLPMIVR